MAKSLTQSLFGSVTASIDTSDSDKKTEKTEGDTNRPLSQLFDSSSTLPDRPQHFDHATPSRSKTNDAEDNPSSTSQRMNKNEEPEKYRRNPRRRTRPSNDDENSAGLTVDSNDEDERTIFVGNLPKDTTRKSLAAIFRSCGKVQSTRLRSVPTAGVKVAPEYAGNQNLVKKVSANTNKLLEDTPKKTAQGYVVFETVESVKAALRLDGTLLPGGGNFRLRVDHASPSVDSSRSVFVGNLRYAADESTLRDHFLAGCGWDDGGEEHRDAVKAVRLIRDAETQQCKGFGYVLLKDASYVSEVLKTMNGSIYMERSLRVMVCGSRFKGKRGVEKDGIEEGSNGYRGGKKLKPRWKQHDKDKQRAEKAAAGDAPRKGAVGNSSIKGVVAKRKKRGAKKNSGVIKAAAGRANGISKRAAAGKKREKRINKLQKRMTKGMGKMKK